MEQVRRPRWNMAEKREMQRLENSLAKSEWRLMWLEHSRLDGQRHVWVLRGTDMMSATAKERAESSSPLESVVFGKKLDFPLSTMGSHLIYMF